MSNARRAALFFLLLAVVQSSAACLVLSINPVYDGDTMSWDPALVGEWQDADDKTSLQIQAGEWRSYKIHYVHPIETGDLTGYLTAIDDARYLDVMPAHADLDALHGKLESRYKIYKLRDALVELEATYDAIYIDTPPALNFYTRSALIAVERCLIPFDCDDFSRRALYTLLDNVKEIQQDHNDALEVEGIVINQFQPRASLPAKLLSK